nr:MAG TPA: Type I restriction enzyme [Caudoviricetes sp.]
MNLFTENVDFYPTPEEVINTMMLGEDFLGKTILEPSAGSGNIVRWLKSNGASEVIACEKEKYLQKLLVGECNLLAEDFLSVTAEQVSHIDYIVMNPPFSNGVKHIKHAFDIAPAGCTIIALCNTSNLENSYSSERQELRELIALYGCSENLGAIFVASERRTDVQVSLIKLYKEAEGEDEFAGYMFSNEEDILEGNKTEGLVQYNVVRDMVNRYTSAVKLFDETLAAANKINEIAKFSDDRFDYMPIRFATVDANSKCVDITRQQYKKQLQKYYWRIIFNKLNMEKYATQELRNQINKFVEKQSNVPFTMHNIYQVLNMVIQTTGQRMNKALEEAFDMICSFSADNSTAGEKWKTNANYMVNRKFIVPYMTSYDSRYNNTYVKLSYSGNEVKINDVVKALCYVNGVTYDEKHSLRNFIYDKGIRYGEWYEWSFFRIKAFKKGTMHFEFLDENVWMRFNQVVASQRGWVLPKKSRKGK